MSAPILLPNFGAEEGERRGATLDASPILQEVGVLWCLIFGAEARLLGASEPAPWPEALGPRREAPAFPWIERRRRGVAWLSTRPAWDELREAGAAPAMPPPSVVERVHDKGFALEVARERGLVPPSLEGHLELLSPLDLSTGVATGRIAEWLAKLPPWVHGSWTIKPRLGSSGRGRIGGRDAGAAGTSRAQLSASALSRLARRGGAICEPWLTRIDDLSTLLYVSRAGDVELLGTTRQILSPAGGYQGSCGLLDPEGRSSSGSSFDEELRHAGRALGAAAASAGFFGPCGVDAFTFAGPNGEELRPVVELNARFTMGIIALGLLERAREADLLRGKRSFRFLLRTPAQQQDPDATPAIGEVLRIPLWREAVLLLSSTDELVTAG